MLGKLWIVTTLTLSLIVLVGFKLSPLSQLFADFVKNQETNQSDNSSDLVALSEEGLVLGESVDGQSTQETIGIHSSETGTLTELLMTGDNLLSDFDELLALIDEITDWGCEPDFEDCGVGGFASEPTPTHTPAPTSTPGPNPNPTNHPSPTPSPTEARRPSPPPELERGDPPQRVPEDPILPPPGYYL